MMMKNGNRVQEVKAIREKVFMTEWLVKLAVNCTVEHKFTMLYI